MGFDRREVIFLSFHFFPLPSFSSLLLTYLLFFGNLLSLTATISFYRPDLVDHHSNGPSPIPLNPPVNYLSGK